MTMYQIKLSDKVQHRPYLKRSDKYSAKELSHILLATIYAGYNHSIEPILIIGKAVMAPFRDNFLEICRGFPVAYLYGPTSSGKTNILHNIVYLYGYTESFINGGDSTIISMWHNLDKLNRIPVIYDEISQKVINDSQFEGLIKSAYQGINRDKVSQKHTNVNAPLILSSNFYPPQKPEILNRLLLCNFDQKNFKLNKIIDFNEIRESYLSNLLPAVLRYGSNNILDIFKAKRSCIRELNGNIDIRSVDNIAIAYTGYQVLLDIAEETQPNEIKESFEKFVKNYADVLKIESPWEEFLNSLPLLSRNKSIVAEKDYKYAYNKQESQENDQLITNLSVHYLCIHFERTYESFIKHYRQLKKEIPPTKKELLAYAKNDIRVISGRNQLTKSININGIKKRCLVIDVNGNYELSHLERM